MLWPERDASARMKAIATEMPTAAETKFWTVRPAICWRFESVVSPA